MGVFLSRCMNTFELAAHVAQQNTIMYSSTESLRLHLRLDYNRSHNNPTVIVTM